MILKSITEIKKGDIKSFSCGNKDLDRFLKEFAFQNDFLGYGKTFILEDKDEVVGFFTICSASIRFDEYPLKGTEKLPRYPIPSIRIARLAVKKDKQGMGYGKELLKQAFLRIVSVSKVVGVRIIVVDAKESSFQFYEKYGFSKLETDKLSYFILLDTIKEALK